MWFLIKKVEKQASNAEADNESQSKKQKREHGDSSHKHNNNEVFKLVDYAEDGEVQ